MARWTTAAASRLAGYAWTALSALAAVAAVMTIAAHARAAEPPSADASVIDALRKGGYVVYMRHGLTDQTGVPDDTADLARCETQRNLSDAGRHQAAQVGKAVKALRIPIGKVLASPFCRTRETAEIAFGRYEVDKDLAFVIESGEEEAKRLGTALKKLLSTPPKAGTNTVLVSHSANLREAAGIFAKPEGAAYVFRPLPNGGFQPVAKLLAEDWPRLADRFRGVKAH